MIIDVNVPTYILVVPANQVRNLHHPLRLHIGVLLQVTLTETVQTTAEVLPMTLGTHQGVVETMVVVVGVQGTGNESSIP